MPRLAHSVTLKAPTPTECILRGVVGPTAVGKIAPEPIAVIAQYKAPELELNIVAAPLDTGPKWSVDNSVFAPRKQTSDGHSLWTTKKLVTRNVCNTRNACLMDDARASLRGRLISSL